MPPIIDLENDVAAATVDEYLADLPDPQRSTLAQLRAVLQELLPEAEEGLSYGVPAFKVNGRPVAGYAGLKNHCSYFPHSGSILSQLVDELTGYSWSKGTLRFPIDAPLPNDLVRRMVELRMEQIS